MAKLDNYDVWICDTQSCALIVPAEKFALPEGYSGVVHNGEVSQIPWFACGSEHIASSVHDAIADALHDKAKETV